MEVGRIAPEQPGEHNAAIASTGRIGVVLMVYICIKLQLDLQAGKSPDVVKGPFFPQV
jgi:hypothetical protein